MPMKFKHNLLSCAISLALGCASGTVYSAEPKPNTKPFALSRTHAGSYVKLAGSESGKFLAVWSVSAVDILTAQRTFYVASRYTNQGSTVGGEIKIAETTDPDISFSLGQKSVAMDADGDAVVCWAASNETKESSQISCRLVPKDSDNNIATETISVNTPGYVYQFSVAMDNGGDFIVAWINGDAVMARRFAAGGAAKAEEFLVSDNSSGTTVSVAMDPDGDAIVAWESNGIVARRIDKDGNMPDAFKVDRTPENVYSESDDGNKTSSTAYSVGHPSVAMDDAGNFTVAWQRSQLDGKSTTKLKKGKCHKEYGYTYCDDDEYVTTSTSVSSTGIFAQRFENGNAVNKNKKTKQQEDIAIGFKKKQEHVSPDIAMDAAGNFVVGWEQDLIKKQCSTYDGEKSCHDEVIGSNIFARKYNSLKKKLEGVQSVIGKSKGSPSNSNPSVALIDDGSFEVGWISTYYNKEDYQDESKASARLFPAKKK